MIAVFVYVRVGKKLGFALFLQIPEVTIAVSDSRNYFILLSTVLYDV